MSGAFPVTNLVLILQNLLLLCGSIHVVGAQWSHSKLEDTGCSAREWDALVQFKRKLADPNGLLSSWKGTDCCRWKGVGCGNNTDSGHVRVIELDLHNTEEGVFNGFFNYSLALTGELDASLVNLEHLQHLDLSGNDLGQSSPFPDFISDFHDLKSLNLSGTGLFGVIPSKLGNLSRIKSIDFSFNTGLTLRTGILFSNLLSLEYVDMTGVNMGSALGWLESLNTLPWVSVVRLVQCGIESIPDSLPVVNFTSLTTLDLSRNYMIDSKFPNWLFRLTRIEHLNFGNTASSAHLPPIPLGIQNLRKLRFLDFSGNQIIGSIPESLGNLPFLEEINLSDNNLSGPIPKSLGRLSLLRNLDLSNNELSHSIPESIFNISSLQKLHVSSNNLTGSIPTQIGTRLSSLQHLNLRSNSLTGLIPASIGNIKYLEELDLSQNKFLGPIPESFCKLSKLKIFDISVNNDINGSIPRCVLQNPLLETLGIGGQGVHGVVIESDFEKLSNLINLKITASKLLVLNISQNWIPPFHDLSLLYLYSCKVGPKFPMWIQTQKKLIGLSLTHTGISGNLPPWIWNFSSLLMVIDVSNNQLMGKIPNLTYAPSISIISFGFNKFQGFDWLLDLSKMIPMIQFLSLTANNLNGTIPSSLCKSQLETLDLSGNHFSGEIPSCLMNVRSYLNLARNNLHGPFPSPNSSLCNLTSVHLDNNNLAGVIPISFKTCTNVIILDLGHNRFSGNIPSWIANTLLSLKVLVLKSNMFSGEIHPLLPSLPSLQVLDLSQNTLSGRIPRTFGGFSAMKHKHLIEESMGDFYGESISITMKGQSLDYAKLLSLVTSIDLSNNRLVGDIPGKLGDLIGLVNLNLSRNDFTGGIPDAISGLVALETLDFSLNHLSGQIPKTMLMLTSLTSFNLSFNNLSGSIPTGNQFQTFNDPSIYMGNSNLCGHPRKSCDNNQESPFAPVIKTNDYERPWIYLSFILGFILGFWVFYGTLFFNKTWRYSYFQFLSDFPDMIYVWCIKHVGKMFK